MPRLFLRGELLGHVDAILFDKDGTLSHSEPMLTRLAQKRIEKCIQQARLLDPPTTSPPSPSLRELLQRAYGLTGVGVHPAGAIAVGSHEQNLISTATVLAQVGYGWPDALALARDVFSDHGPGPQPAGILPPPQPTDGALELIERLSAARVLCAVISNDHMHGIRTFISDHGLSHHFQAHWSAEHRPSKPDPEAALGLCHALGVSPSSCALIGDADSDLRMARAAGLPVVLGYTGGWSLPVILDQSFQQFVHWREIEVRA